MPVTITYTGATPTVDADFDTWGDELNDDALGPIKADLDALAAQGNASEPLASGALQRTGGAMTGPIGLGDPTAASAADAGYRGLPVVSIDADYVLVAKDAGKIRRLTGTTARSWTIPPNVLAVGHAVTLRNAGTAALSIVRGAGVELRVAGSATNANRSLSPQGFATITQEDTNIWIISGAGIT